MLKGIDLFCGIGGFRLAMDNNGVKCVFSSDNDKFAQQTYNANFGEVPQGDIKQIEAKDIPHFDILTAGFPCQPFSYAGEKKGFEDEIRGTLFFDICRILEYHKPSMVFLENVKGLKSHENGKTLEIIISKLKDLGYFPHWTILSSLDFGLPQKRERWYCVAFRDDVSFEFPKPLGGTPILRDIIDLNDDNPSLKLPQFELDRIDYHFSVAKDGERVKHDNSKYAPNTKKGKYGIYSFQKKDGSLRFHVGDTAKTQIQEAFYSCLDTYASTIIANRTPKLWDIRRKLSVLEAQRLQGFPDNFIFPVSDAQAYHQLGNSVSVPIIDPMTMCVAAESQPLMTMQIPVFIYIWLQDISLDCIIYDISKRWVNLIDFILKKMKSDSQCGPLLGGSQSNKTDIRVRKRSLSYTISDSA